jgi:tRNA threonylcarbamoyladenosine biosynthesis protein TsaB
MKQSSMKILGLETSARESSIGLLVNGRTETIHLKESRGQIAELLPAIEQLLNHHTLQLGDLTALAFSAGPGSFTGLRVGLGILQGIALAHDFPVATISSLRVLAQTAYRSYGHKKVVTQVNAFMDEMYVGHYSANSEGVMIPERPDELVHQHDDVALLDYTSVGDIGAGISEVLYPAVEDLLMLAAMEVERGNTQSIESVFPYYLRQKEAWKIARKSV